MGSADQAATFAALTAEDKPFRWQVRLLGRFVDGDVPAGVDIPTGLGKTSVMALWLMALATGANLPRRLVYVVDRRAVVDHATRFAERLRRNLPSAGLADELGLGGRPLPISTLRGGFADNRDWLDDPSLPAIVVGTVDMVGSRLLFAGYGVSRRMRPYHAGFLGVDTLVVLDEAHLCPSFEALLRDVAERRDSVFGPTGRGARAAGAPLAFRLLSLSATGREFPWAVAQGGVDPVFRLQEKDQDEAVVRDRLTARKRLGLIRIGNPKSLADELAQCAAAHGNCPPARVLVYCDSRTVAVQVRKRIEQAIETRAKTDPGGVRGACELLVGERRAYERRAVERWLEHRGFLGGARSTPLAPTFLVATSAGEVGVDLDADHLTCDLVAYERMAQRLGRVNRRGGATRSAWVDVLIPRADGDGGRDTAAAIDARTAALAQLPRGEDGRHDASPLATMRVRSGDAAAALIERATTPAPLYPELTRPLAEAWAMTSLKDHAGRPEVEPWLRGWEEQEEPHTTVVWRRYLPQVRVGGSSYAPSRLVASFFDNAPIHASERLETVTSHVSRWLFARAERLRMQPADQDRAVGAGDLVALVLDRAGELVTAVSLYGLLSAVGNRARMRSWERLVAGATVVVDAAIGGLAGGMLDESSEEAVSTADVDEAWQGIPEGPGSERPMIRFRVRPLVGDPDGDGLQGAELDGWRHVRTFETEFDGGGGLLKGLAVFVWPGDSGDEEAGSVRTKPQALRDHADQVVARVRAMAARLGLPAGEADALVRAAELHDEGKAAGRWQDAMNAPVEGRPYAKTRGGGDWRLQQGYRHEFGSLLRAEQASLPAETRDLILHLVAAHHGHARPSITTAGCEEAPPSVLAATARDAALRYARLQRRYGLWGLAWREAILRAADQSASREGPVGG